MWSDDASLELLDIGHMEKGIEDRREWNDIIII